MSRNLTNLMRSALAAGALLAASSVLAAPEVLGIERTDPGVQQKADHPCVVGNSTCSNGAFPYTNYHPHGDPAQGIYSPVYERTLIETTILGDTFFIGVDVNTRGSTPPKAVEVLLEFLVQGCDDAACASRTTLYAFNPQGGYQLDMVNPGSGYSDDRLFVPNGATRDPMVLSQAHDYYRFFAKWSSDVAGADGFFLIPGPPSNGVPAPGALALVVAGLLGLGAWRRAAGARR